MIRQLALCMLIASATLIAPYASAADQSGGKLEAAFKKADTDNDGTLTKIEAKSMPRVAKNFDAIDTDKDGTVSLDEIRASMKKASKAMHDRGVERFKSADKDNDGTLTKDEAKSLPRVAKNFDAIDTDKDGTVSEKEIHDYMKAQHSKK
ncbi:MAG: EF-hand domain-containing protein [Betaproteobacteria bacterium]|nr:EF-hand domain-containing protein [Betaproteobacteria bacterium]